MSGLVGNSRRHVLSCCGSYKNEMRNFHVSVLYFRQYECVFTEMQVCGETAIDLYIKAVNMEKYKINLEMGFGIKESYDGCGGASDLCYSLLALTVGCFLSMLNN